MPLTLYLDKKVSAFIPSQRQEKNNFILSLDPIQSLKDYFKKQLAAESGLIFFIDLQNLIKVLNKFGLHKLACACIKFIAFSKAEAKKKPSRLKLSYPYLELRSHPLKPQELDFILHHTDYLCHELLNKQKKETLKASLLKDIYEDQQDLIAIGQALSTKKDIASLCRLILELSRKITGADAGTIYLIEKNNRGEKLIRVKFSETFSKKINFEESILPYNTGSIAGYVAINGQSLNLPDVYKLSPKDPISFNPVFDFTYYYRTKSMLAVPMRNHHNEIIGVIQLINSKENPKLKKAKTEAHAILLAHAADFEKVVVPFKKRYVKLMEAIANQAAIALENAWMLEQIEHQFEEFVKASVTAIESRDPATSGHSFRVARLCLTLAEAVNQTTEGPLAKINFSAVQKKQLEYAALLHDFGKIYLDPRIFLKAQKLFPEEFKILLLKLQIAYLNSELESYKEELSVLRSSLAKVEKSQVTKREEERAACRQKILALKEKLKALNEPSLADSMPQLVLEELTTNLKDFSCENLDGQKLNLLEEHERLALSVAKGSLSPEERIQIQKHVVYTYDFVSNIPWPPEYARIPEITYAHHEFLDGTGYPRGLRGKDQIPLEARMITIADIFDALTSGDRSYKKAVGLEKALSIIEEEVKHGRLDPDLYKLFCKFKIWEKIAPN